MRKHFYLLWSLLEFTLTDMGRKEKLRERFLKLPADFTFDEMQSLLVGYGYEKSGCAKS